MKLIGKWFIDGIVLLVPVVLAGFVFFYLFELFSSPLDLWIKSVFPSLPLALITAKLLAVGVTFFVIVVTGYLGTRWVLAKLLNSVHNIFLKIPIVRKIFHSTHEVVHTLLKKEDRGFTDVVLFPFGDTEGYVVSFLPRKDGLFEESHTALLLPGTPNPLQGFVLYVESDKISPSELSRGEAMKWNISIGSVNL